MLKFNRRRAVNRLMGAIAVTQSLAAFGTTLAELDMDLGFSFRFHCQEVRQSLPPDPSGRGAEALHLDALAP